MKQIKQDIIVKKYMLEIKQYPDGREFQSITPIGKFRRAFAVKNDKEVIPESKVVGTEDW